MNDEPASTRTLKQRWDEEDAVRDEQEKRAQQLFLEVEANQTFAPIEDFLIRLSKVLSAAAQPFARLGRFATLLVPKAEPHARHEIRCRTGLQSIGAHLR